MFVQAAFMALQAYLGIVFQKRPKKVSFEEFLGQNKGDETRPVPYVRGRWKLTPQRIWLGDYSLRAVERDSKWTDFLLGAPLGPAASIGFAALLDTVTVSYTYHVGQVLELSWGEINRVYQVFVDDLACAVPPSSDNAGGTILLDFPTAFGGDQPPGGGGVYGLCDILPGSYTQGRNSYLASLIDANVPALRGKAALIVRGRTGNHVNSGYFGAGPNGAPLRTWSVEIGAWPDNLGTGFHKLPDESYNRVEVLYEWATKPDYGAEYPVADIHLPSWREAAEITYNEGNGFSGLIETRGTNISSIIEELKASIDAEIFEHPADGLKIKLIRKTISIPSTVLNETNIGNVEEYTPGDYGDTYNKVVLPYANAANNYQPRPAQYEDRANWHIQRRVVPREVSYAGVSNAETAQMLATRDGRVLGQPWPPVVIDAGEDARGLYPGEPFIFSWPDPQVEMVARAQSYSPNSSEDSEKSFRIVATEDQYSTGLSSFGAPSTSGHTNPAGGLNTAPPSASWNTADFPPDGLTVQMVVGNGGGIQTAIVGGVTFGSYPVGGQYARVYVTGPGGTESLTPIRLQPDENDEALLVWPVAVEGEYEFCVQTYSPTGATNGVKVCASVEVVFTDAVPAGAMTINGVLVTQDGEIMTQT